MSKYNKIRGILKAQEGLQFPRIQNIWDKINSDFWDSVTKDFTLFQNNPYITQGVGQAQSLPGASITHVFPENTFNTNDVTTDSNSKKILNKIGTTVMDPKIMAQGFDMIGSMFGQDVVNSKGIDAAFGTIDTIGNAAMSINPGVGAIIKGVGAAGKMINDIGGKKSEDFSINKDVVASLGGSYTDSVSDFYTAASKAGKKYGLFSNSSRKKANNQIKQARKQQNIMTDIYNKNQNYLAMSGNDLNYLRYGFEQDGGYDQRYMRVAKQGTKLQGKIDFIKERRNKINSIINLDSKEIEWQPTIVEEIESFKEGGIIESSEEWTPTIVIEEWEPTIIEYKDGGTLEVEEWEPVIVVEEFQNGGLVKPSFEDWFNSIPEKHRNNQYDYKLAYQDLPIEMLLNHAKDPYQFHLKSVSSNIDENGRIPFLKLGTLEENPELKGELIEWYEKGMSDGKPLEGKDKETWEDFKSKFEPKYIDGRYYYIPKKFKDGGKTKEKEETPEIEETTQKNIIPEGALHKNKHHIEHTDGLTQKGIPVVDNDGKQQAEVECEEIIFTLEVTKALEERYHKYYSDELTQKEKDELAIEAGKLLVREILYNTDDRANLIEKCEKGGKL